MQIDDEGNMALTAAENQELMDQLEIPAEQYDDPPVAIESVDFKDGVATFRATNTRTGKTTLLTFDLAPESP